MNLLIILLMMFHSIDHKIENEVDMSYEGTTYQGVKLELAGVVICDENGHKVHNSALKDQINKNFSVQDVIDVLGAGYLSPNSGTGGISWYFNDGSMLTTVLWPESLAAKVNLITPE